MPLPAKLAAMVSWYNPFLLLRTGYEMTVSKIMGGHADHRLMQSVITGPALIHDYSCTPMRTISLDQSSREEPEGSSRQSLWIDFVADTGDGWDPTYAVAYSIAHPLPFGPYETKRGEILVFGGDVVYPTASLEVYEGKLLLPYEHAFDSVQYRGREPKPGNPDVFAIPGNHDWYDSLVLFSKQFCSRVLFAGCRTRQRRSYFALKLPHNWWMLGIDVQLGSDLDGPQIEYFSQVAEHMPENARLIVCIHEPQWIPRHTEDWQKPLNRIGCLHSFQNDVLHREIQVFLAGDLHHYRRHEHPTQHTQKITSGGGGAFLHPTSEVWSPTLPCGCVEKESYPRWWQSWWMGWSNPFFLLWKNRLFGVLPALLYIFLAWNLFPILRQAMTDTFIRLPPNSTLGEYLYEHVRTMYNIVTNPENEKDPSELSQQATSILLQNLMWFAILWLAFALFTDVKNKGGRAALALLHLLGHYLMMMLVLWYILKLCYHLEFPIGANLLDEEHFTRFGKARFYLAFPALIILMGAAGWLLGSLVWGLYLSIAFCFFQVHSNEAFSSQAIIHWKNFVRLNIREDGRLLIYPIGIRNVPQKWKCQTEGEAGPAVVPEYPASLQCELIEGPIVVPPPPPSA